jgi:hypothetical protein
MTPILGIMASQISGHLAVANNYESIATVAVTTAVSSITFSSIPGTYKHLQIRGVGKAVSSGIWVTLKMNSDATSGNYYAHRLLGNGSSASFGNQAGSSAGIDFTTFYPTGSTAFVTDILDYANTNKAKTVRTLSGYDANGTGELNYMLGYWAGTSAITTLTFGNTANFEQYTHFALYGVK